MADVPNNASLNKSAITHVRVIDVVGSINASYATYDSYGNKINDPFTTPFASSGFDLDAVGVINQASGRRMKAPIEVTEFSMYPNPATDLVRINSDKEATIVIYDFFGRIVKNNRKGGYQEINTSDLKKGTYIVEITINDEKQTKRLSIK